MLLNSVHTLINIKDESLNMQCENGLLIKSDLLNWFNNIKQHASSTTGLVSTPLSLILGPLTSNHKY